MKREKNFVTINKKSAKVLIKYADTVNMKLDSMEVLIEDVNEKTLEKTAKTFVPEGLMFCEAKIIERIESKIGVPMDAFLQMAIPVVDTENLGEQPDLSKEINKYKYNIIKNISFKRAVEAIEVNGMTSDEYMASKNN